MNFAASFRPATSFHDPEQLFCDGGVVGENTRGKVKAGTWAYRLVSQGVVIREMSGVILPEQVAPCEMSNNITEFLALVKGMMILPFDWRGTIWSDSKVTLGRVFCKWALTNIPDWLWSECINHKARLVHWNQIHYGLLDGHPTKEQLAAGVGKRGHPVSPHNVWCDRACKQVSDTFLRQAEQVQVGLEEMFARPK